MHNLPDGYREKRERYIEADCGHECYDGELLYSYDGGWICPDCLAEVFDSLPLREKAELIGCDNMIVEGRGN